MGQDVEMSVYSIECPKCGAPLDLLGGKRVSTVTCRYCSSVIDLQKEYRVLSTFRKIRIRPGPFKVGMSGEIEGIEYTIIGLVAYSCRKGIGTGEDTWIEYQLYSPLYGYAWLSYENGVLIFSRRYRDIPDKKMISLETKEKVRFAGRVFRFYERYFAYVTYVQGELTYIARQDDRVTISEAIAPPYGFSMEKSPDEIEYNLNRYVEAGPIYDSFGIKGVGEGDFHPLKPYRNDTLKRLSFVSIPFTLLYLVVSLYILFFHNGKVIADTGFTGARKEMNIMVDDPSHLLRITIDSGLNNDWQYYDISLTDRNGSVIFECGRDMEYYHGVEGGERWSEGSRESHIYTKVPSPGEYRLSIEAPEYHRMVTTRVVVSENVIRPLYFGILLLISFIAGTIYFLASSFYRQRVWNEVAEDDD
jgi:hypothetical protein